VILIRGAVPGPKGALVLLRSAAKARALTGGAAK
jgi:large subunit ribosomal protein L3